MTRLNDTTPALHAVVGGAGKTCAAHLIRSVVEQGLRRRCGLITARHTYLGEEVLPPPAWPDWRGQLDARLAEMRTAGCQDVVLTLPPFALGSASLEGLSFETVAFTGGGSEDSEQLAAFRRSQRGWCLFNLDDPDLRTLAGGGRTVTYAERRGEADLNARNLRLLPERIEFEALTNNAIFRVSLPVPGGFSLYNALAALAFGLRCDLRLDALAAILKDTRGVRGRMELLTVPAPYDVMIDSASTPEQLENLLLTARPMSRGRLILVLGAPGDRNLSRRPLLGEAASRADVVILTEDDPRTESTEEICRQIRSGMEGKRPEIITDRRAAIDRALSLAGPGDLVLLSGRGDKTTMLVRDGVVPLDERTVVQSYFRQKRDRKRKDA